MLVNVTEYYGEVFKQNCDLLQRNRKIMNHPQNCENCHLLSTVKLSILEVSLIILPQCSVHMYIHFILWIT